MRAHLPPAEVDVRLAAGANLVAVHELGGLELPTLEQLRRPAHLLRVTRLHGLGFGLGRRDARALARLGHGRDGLWLARKLQLHDGTGVDALEEGGGRLGRGGRLAIHGHDPITHLVRVRVRVIRIRIRVRVRVSLL